MEVMVPELEVQPTLIGSADLRDIVTSTRITPHHPDEETRADGYWPAYIVKGHKSTRVHVAITLSGTAPHRLVSVWTRSGWMCTG